MELAVVLYDSADADLENKDKKTALLSFASFYGAAVIADYCVWIVLAHLTSTCAPMCFSSLFLVSICLVTSLW